MSLYCIERPAKTSKVKAIPLFLIHGYGSDENDLFNEIKSEFEALPVTGRLMIYRTRLYYRTKEYIKPAEP